MASSNRTRRIAKELGDIEKDVNSHVQCYAPNQADLTKLKASFKGPEGTVYEGGTYHVDIKIPDNYPFKPPIMRFETRIWHPNVSSQTGAICLDTLGSAWSPVLTIKSAILSLQSLLNDPEPKDPQDAMVATMLIQNPAEFERTAREWAHRYAGAPRSTLEKKTATPSLPPLAAKQLTEAEKMAQYRGYHRDLVNRFCDMGFDVPTVVAAFEYVGIDRNGGMNYQLEEAYNGDILARLLNEP